MKFQILSDGAGLRSLEEKNSKNKGHHQVRGKIMLPQVRTYEPCLVWILIRQNLSVSLSNILSLKLSMVSLLWCKLVLQVLFELNTIPFLKALFGSWVMDGKMERKRREGRLLSCMNIENSQYQKTSKYSKGGFWIAFWNV